ncbi:MAG: hypothetical protein QXV93_06650 [Zestosphaera sp.]
MILPSEVTIPSIIVAVFMLVMIVASVIMNLNYVLIVFREARRMSESLVRNDRLKIIEGHLIDETTLEVKLTALEDTVAPLTSVQFIVCYKGLNEHVFTYLLKYSNDEGPGWSIYAIHSGRVVRSLEGNNYLIPGEIVIARLRLPIPKSSEGPVVVVVVSPGGSKSSWVIDDA